MLNIFFLQNLVKLNCHLRKSFTDRKVFTSYCKMYIFLYSFSLIAAFIMLFFQQIYLLWVFILFSRLVINSLGLIQSIVSAPAFLVSYFQILMNNIYWFMLKSKCWVLTWRSSKIENGRKKPVQLGRNLTLRHSDPSFTCSQTSFTLELWMCLQ